ncbi:MAG: biotin--[acetyl-CoA-carboxylase] ligase [Anaerolineaceae bacterium]|nr:biotin--[acetyl-CoA-carboxylase] ligase [Anaerolineaceae bacterium]
MDRVTHNSMLSDIGVSEIKYFDSIGSTNDIALQWIEDGALDFSIVVADQQTKGRGRLGRKWVTNPGSALAVSLVVKPSLAERESISLFSPLAALALASTLEEKYSLKPQIKWPNDLLINEKKISGILVEASWTGLSMAGVVVGIGINIAPSSLPPAELLSFPATYLEAETNCTIDRFDLLKSYMIKIKHWRSIFATEQFFNEWRDRLAFMDRPVRIEATGRGTIHGILNGISTSGNLLLKNKDGELVEIEVGDVHLRPDFEK